MGGRGWGVRGRGRKKERRGRRREKKGEEETSVREEKGVCIGTDIHVCRQSHIVCPT